MKNYLILSYSNLDELASEVNHKCREGWRPQGGPFALPGESGFVFLQAIIRPEEDVTINISPNKKQLERRESGRISAA